MNEEALSKEYNNIITMLKKRRIELGFSQYDLARRTGLARKTIICMEQGKHWLGVKQLAILCDALFFTISLKKTDNDNIIK